LYMKLIGQMGDQLRLLAHLVDIILAHITHRTLQPVMQVA